DTKSYALISAVYNLNVENEDLAADIFVKRKPRRVTVFPTEAAYRVDYKFKNGKWHYGYSNILLTFKVDWKGKLFNSVYTLQSEMVITDWEFNESENLRGKEQIRPNVILADEASGFADPEFWGEYNIIEPEKSIEQAIRKINRNLNREK
ncbi:MAG: carboxypeptidase-like regulatory domain-containing protein, partial [Flavobacteriaceae bacterium]|nr:carboxypeptidase-like regulatory domain-containing protein [Flavobacteriaceae bacterium]